MADARARALQGRGPTSRGSVSVRVGGEAGSAGRCLTRITYRVRPPKQAPSLLLRDGRRTGTAPLVQLAEPVHNRLQDAERRLRSVDLEHQRFIIEPKRVEGLFVVDMKSPLDDFLIDIIEAVLA